MTAIIFGAKGQDGIYLTQLLYEKKYTVITINRDHAAVNNGVNNFENICALVKKHQPEYIFHFAANSTTRHDAWQENHETISTGTLNILEAVRLHCQGAKIFLSGSGLQFKNENKPIKESDPFEAGSIYAVSRIHTVYTARYYRSLGIKVYTGYFFTHDSPYRTERHINKKILNTVKRIAAGSTEKLAIGDISVKKEFGFAGDIVKGIWTLVTQDNVFETVIGTGVAHAIEEWLDICFSMYDLDSKKYVEPIPGFVPEYKVLVSDPATIFSLGWKPETDIYLLAKLMNTQS